MKRLVDYRLGIAVVFAWIGLWFATGSSQDLDTIAIALWVAAGVLLVLTWLLRALGGLLALVALTLSFAALFVSSASWQLGDHAPSALNSGLNQDWDFVVEIDGSNCVVDTSSSDGRALVRIRSAENGEIRLTNLNAPAVIYAQLSSCDLGLNLDVSAKLVATSSGSRFAYRLFANSAPTIRSGPSGILSISNSLRNEFRDASARIGGDAAGLLPGLAIGDTSNVEPSLDSSMKIVSLSHLTAVSGANCAVVVGLILAVGMVIGLPRALRVFLALGALACFVILVTPEPSVVRASVMAVIALLAISSGRATHGVSILALSVLVILTFDPWLAKDFGFALSVSATVGLLLLVAPLRQFLCKFLPDWLALLIAIPASAQIACGPILILLNPNLPLYAIPANLLAEPAAPIATILGLVGCLLLPIAHPVGVFLVWIASVPTAWIASIARTLAELPFAQIPWLMGVAGALSLAVLSGLLILSLTFRNRFYSGVAGAIVGFVALAYVGASIGLQFERFANQPQDWTVASCDVGQGDALVIRSAGRFALIDLGPDPKLLKDCLDRLGISKVDLLILSHFDLDHVGGIGAITSRVGVAIVGPTSGQHDESVLSQLEDGGAIVQEAAAGMRGSLGALDWTILWPIERTRGLDPGNTSSVVIEFHPKTDCESGCFSSLFLGDLDAESQLRLLGENTVSEFDVVKVAHHGSADQLDELYAQIRAKVAIISVGAGNDYGHPTFQCLQILERTSSNVFRTDESGMILVSRTSQAPLEVWTSN